ncbi:MAG: hypothetical protein HYU37_17110 [Acidobacteria bacterium]|nr:hypothetical protein [Acidobacteriota bacterium]
MIEQFVTGGVLIGSGCLAVAASRAVLVGVLRLMTAKALLHAFRRPDTFLLKAQRLLAKSAAMDGLLSITVSTNGDAQPL